MKSSAKYRGNRSIYEKKLASKRFKGQLWCQISFQTIVLLIFTILLWDFVTWSKLSCKDVFDNREIFPDYLRHHCWKLIPIIADFFMWRSAVWIFIRCLRQFLICILSEASPSRCLSKMGTLCKGIPTIHKIYVCFGFTATCIFLQSQVRRLY